MATFLWACRHVLLLEDVQTILGFVCSMDAWVPRPQFGNRGSFATRALGAGLRSHERIEQGGKQKRPQGAARAGLLFKTYRILLDGYDGLHFFLNRVWPEYKFTSGTHIDIHGDAFRKPD
jgi:hypothetical protein